MARSKRKRILFRIALLIVAGAALWAVFWSPLLRVRQVAVEGAAQTPRDDVVAAASVGEEDNLLLVSTDEIADRVEKLPWVRTADVDRLLPATVRIRITERTPYMILSLGAARWTIDPGGRVLGSGEAVDGLPVIAGAKVSKVEPGRRLKTPETTGALAVHRHLPKALRERVVALFAPSVDRITLSLVDGPLVRYGAPELLDEKNEVLANLLARLASEGREVEYIDVRVPSSPAIGPEVAPEGEGTTPETTPTPG